MRTLFVLFVFLVLCFNAYARDLQTWVLYCADEEYLEEGVTKWRPKLGGNLIVNKKLLAKQGAKRLYLLRVDKDSDEWNDAKAWVLGNPIEGIGYWRTPRQMWEDTNDYPEGSGVTGRKIAERFLRYPVFVDCTPGEDEGCPRWGKQRLWVTPKVAVDTYGVVLDNAILASCNKYWPVKWLGE